MAKEVRCDNIGFAILIANLAATSKSAGLGHLVRRQCVGWARMSAYVILTNYVLLFVIASRDDWNTPVGSPSDMARLNFQEWYAPVVGEFLARYGWFIEGLTLRLCHGGPVWLTYFILQSVCSTLTYVRYRHIGLGVALTAISVVTH